MTNSTSETLSFPACRKRRVEARFDGGDVTSNGGVLLLRQADRVLDLTARVARGLTDGRQRGKVRHRLVDMVRQRVFGIALGYEDLNDHDGLRHDLAVQTAVERDRPLASAPTLCRFENAAERGWAGTIHEVLVETFIAAHGPPPAQIVLDIDATDDAVHGAQDGRFFHGYYDHYCFLPLYVFCGDHLLVAYLRPANIDPAKHAQAILKLLVARLRQAWPEVRIVLRADSGFCRWRLMSWCERAGLGYILGLARNPRLVALAEPEMAAAEAAYAGNSLKQRRFAELRYAAKTWNRDRRVIARLEHGPKGANPRFVVTNLDGEGQRLYERLYCARGEMENRIKEQQLGLFADRTSCHKWWPNQLRLLLASLAYVLIAAIRRIALTATDMARAQCATIRLKLFKIGAVVTRNTRRIRFMLSSACPDKDLFRLISARLKPG